MTNEITDAQIARKFSDIREALDETYRFASTSPKSHENINFIREVLDEIEAVCVAPLRPIDDRKAEAERLLSIADVLLSAEAKPEMSADERERFEEYEKNLKDGARDVSRTSTGEYLYENVNKRWHAWQAAKADAAKQIAKLQDGINVTRASYAEYPSQCPITGCDFFMYIDHPELGYVPTYGGPFDSYTIPEMEGETSDPFHERELFVRRFDHDRGNWVDNESIPLRVINKNVIFDLEEKAEQTQTQVERAVRLAFDSGVDYGIECDEHSRDEWISDILRELAEQPTKKELS